jgi:putative phosphoribosyl transferase
MHPGVRGEVNRVLFRDRAEAGARLAARLTGLRGQCPLILAVPRGAVVMGSVLARELEGDLDVVLVHKLGAPGEPELAIGAVDEEGRVFLDTNATALGVDDDYIRRESQAQLARLRKRRCLYTPARPPLSPAGRLAVVVDDGVATGASMIVALEAVRRRRPARLIAATAVMPPSTRARLGAAADEIVCLEMPEQFHAVGQFYADFAQVPDGEVVALLRASLRRGPSEAPSRPDSEAPRG